MKDAIMIPIGVSISEAEAKIIAANVAAQPTKALAAHSLGISRKTLYRKLKQMNNRRREEKP